MSFDKESILFYVVVSIFAVTAVVTILGLIQKVSIEKQYLNKLFTALILELVATVIYMAANMDISSQANIQDHDPSEQSISQIEDSAVKQFILTLPLDIQGSVTDVREKLSKKYDGFSASQVQLKLAEEKIISLEKQSADKDGFLNKVSELENIRLKLDNTINLEHNMSRKHNVYLLIQKLLQRIGHYQGENDGDAVKTQEALKNYKMSVGLEDDRYLMTVTQQTIIFIVRDYANTLLDELAK